MYTDREPSFPDPVVLCGLMTAAPFLSEGMMTGVATVCLMV